MNISSTLRKSPSGHDCGRRACDCKPQVRQSAKVQFSNYQANGMMAVAKKLGMAPRQLAEQVLTHLNLTVSPAKLRSPVQALSTFSLIRHS
ncbi:hypothetical protein ACNKHM_24630 [Shigella sonnei]